MTRITANCYGVAVAVPKDVHESGSLWELPPAASGIRAIRVHPRDCSSGSSGSHVVAKRNRPSTSHLTVRTGSDSRLHPHLPAVRGRRHVECMTDMYRVLHAASFAALKHQGQTRKGHRKYPYINHPIAVAELLAGVGGVTDP